MTPFYTRFPELASRETRCIHVLEPGAFLPVGSYGFIELYCEELDCDCRRVLVQVTPENSPQTVLATINYGWESAEFYSRWTHGDRQAGREIRSASLDPLNTQSKYADHLLDFFRNQLMTDSAYVARLARHYAMFKAALREPGGANLQASPTPPPPSDGPPMPIPDILRQLQRVPAETDFSPYRAAMLAAIQQAEAITPELIAAIDRVSADPTRFLEKDQEDWLHLFAIYLLAQFQETRALDAVVRFFSLPEDQSLDLSGDLVTEEGAAVLASVCGGSPAPLLALVQNEAANEFVRVAALYAMAVQVLWDQRPRDAMVTDLRRLFHTLPKPGDAFVWAELVGLVCDFDAPELAPEARQAFAENLVDDSVITLDDFEQDLKEGRKRLGNFRQRGSPIDAVNLCSRWVCFDDEEAKANAWDAPVEADDIDEEDGGEFLAPVIDLPPERPLDRLKPTPYLAPPKVGRNEPCPCGSGKKYKKCCGH